MTLLVDGAATQRSLLLEQSVRYDYAVPVEHLRQRLIVVPPAVHGAQRRRDWSLTVTGVELPARRTRTDRFGNVVVDVGAAHVDGWVRFDVSATVDWSGDPSWTVEADPRYLRPTPLTRATAGLRDLVAGPRVDAAEICARTHRSLTYEWGITGVATSAAEALAGGRGVCQDFAHIMIAACRAAGIAARYVSGHLVGEGGSHAWVEVLRPDRYRPGEWVVEPWDPTHDRQVGAGYLTVAVGRDYTDVAPLSGTYVGERGTDTLTVHKRLGAPTTTRSVGRMSRHSATSS